jgi:hypothetical protein
MESWELIQLNLLSPVVLFFFLGFGARLLHSDLSLPESVYTALSTYLLIAIGLKGGVALSRETLGTIFLPILATFCLGVLIPIITYYASIIIGRLSVADAAAMAAHYGSVSAVTFIASLSFLEMTKVSYEGYVPALVAVLEIPAIIVGLLLGRAAFTKEDSLGRAVGEILAGKSVMLLAGGMLIGFLTKETGYMKVKPFFSDIFQGMLCLFMLDMGLLAANRLGDLRKSGIFVVSFAIIGPICFGLMGVIGGKLSGMSMGGSSVLGAMVASASYIAAPAAVRLALPQANPSIYLTSAVGITFPFNLAVGIPLYATMARYLFEG